MKLSNEFIKKLNKYLELGYVTKRAHEYLPLYILKYTRDAQIDCYKKNTSIEWGEVITACRGLVIDENYNIIAKTFDKFFNQEELTLEEQLKYNKSNFSIREKVDGSLIVLFFYQNEWVLATQKSFYSDIAIYAKKVFDDLLNNGKLNLDKNICYGLEFTSPMNRVVVSYGEEVNFTLLVARDKNTLNEIDIYSLDTGFMPVKRYDDLLNLKPDELKKLNTSNKEGFVITFEDGFRYKIKFDDYLRLHYLLTGISVKEIFNILRSEQNINEILKDTPDEFDTWVLSIVKILKNWYIEKENEIKKESDFILAFINSINNPTKKDIALFVKDKDFIKNKNFILSNFNTENWFENEKTKKYIWTYVDVKRKEAQKKEDGLLPISFFKDPNFEF